MYENGAKIISSTSRDVSNYTRDMPLRIPRHRPVDSVDLGSPAILNTLMKEENYEDFDQASGQRFGPPKRIDDVQYEQSQGRPVYSTATSAVLEFAGRSTS